MTDGNPCLFPLPYDSSPLHGESWSKGMDFRGKTVVVVDRDGKRYQGVVERVETGCDRSRRFHGVGFMLTCGQGLGRYSVPISADLKSIEAIEPPAPPPVPHVIAELTARGYAADDSWQAVFMFRDGFAVPGGPCRSRVIVTDVDGCSLPEPDDWLVCTYDGSGPGGCNPFVSIASRNGFTLAEACDVAESVAAKLNARGEG